jgi:hypothetical protein
LAAARRSEEAKMTHDNQRLAWPGHSAIRGHRHAGQVRVIGPSRITDPRRSPMTIAAKIDGRITATLRDVRVIGGLPPTA